MKTWYVAVMFSPLMGACGGWSSAPDDTAPGLDDDCAQWDPAWAALEDELLGLVNEVRAQGYTCAEGVFGPVAALSTHGALRCAARLHSRDMAVNAFFDHVGSDGSDIVWRVEAQGYQGWSALGENIAAGYPSAAATLQQWLGSDQGHCGNVLAPEWQHLGSGVYFAADSEWEWYWTQDFGALF